MRISDWSSDVCSSDLQTYVRSRLSPAACRDANDSCMKALKPYEAARQEKVEVNLVVPTRIVPTLLAIKGANIVTMRGAEVIDNGTIIVKDGRIEQIGPADRKIGRAHV